MTRDKFNSLDRPHFLTLYAFEIISVVGQMRQLLPIFAMIATVVHAPPDLRPFEWHNRVVVAFAPVESDALLQQQLQTLETAKGGLEEREIRVFAVIGASQSIQSFRDRLGCPGQTFAVVLIGKDGGAKLCKSQPVTADELFSTIDRMPMRRDEMRRKSYAGRPFMRSSISCGDKSSTCVAIVH